MHLVLNFPGLKTFTNHCNKPLATLTESCLKEKRIDTWQNEKELTSRHVERPNTALEQAPRQQTNDGLQ